MSAATVRDQLDRAEVQGATPPTSEAIDAALTDRPSQSGLVIAAAEMADTLAWLRKSYPLDRRAKGRIDEVLKKAGCE